MKKPIISILFFGCVFFITGNLQAIETYAVKHPTGEVSIVYYIEGSQDSVEDVLKSSNLSGLPAVKVDSVDIPADRADRKYWKVQGSKVVIDGLKKAEDQTKKAAEKNEKLQLLKMTEEQYARAKELKLFRD